jgi:GNAT superfamily N-acetyltransferase
MLIRRAESTDAAAIAGIHVRSWQAAYRGLIPETYLDQLSPAQRQPMWERELAGTSWPRKGILVAEIDGQVSGFAGLCPTRDQDENPENVGEIAAIYLAPEVWGAGVGRHLMASALHALGEAEYEQATLWVLDTNARARRFYEAAGWRSDGAVKADTTRGFLLNEIRYRCVFRPKRP